AKFAAARLSAGRATGVAALEQSQSGRNTIARSVADRSVDRSYSGLVSTGGAVDHQNAVKMRVSIQHKRHYRTLPVVGKPLPRGCGRTVCAVELRCWGGRTACAVALRGRPLPQAAGSATSK